MTEEEYPAQEIANAKVQMNAKVKEAYEALSAAKEIADKYKLSFSWTPFYGGGGYYEGDPEERSYENEDGWRSSSQGC